MYKYYVGIDVYKDVLDVTFKYTGQLVYMGQYKNDQIGYRDMLKEVRKSIGLGSKEGFYCFENTGVYSKALLEYLVSQEIACKEENPIQIKRSLGLRRGKNDRVDSGSICQYAYEKRDSIKHSKLDKPLIIKLKKLLGRRELLVKQRVALQISVKEGAIQLDAELAAFIGQQNESLISLYTAQIKAIEKEITATIKSDTEMRKNNELIQTVKGIGPIIGAYMIAFTGNFSKFEDARKFACYCGVAPFSNQSGKFVGKTKVSHLANKRIKSLLSNAVPMAVRYDPQLGRYRQSKLTEGKAKGLIMNNIKNKLIQRVFAVVKRQSPYVVLQ